ncbi:nicotinate-nucleotide--dimethylbenzimidazole phosphoribosyltransferase [Streptomyces sp. ODS05-4]|uniref:nicotinate-nucleotide--dimethylbenzimidazole phosphoribosyltransferase n=1 Tax=Streptomyces sp. ODS05-4 TaxID=2944939 RepID=UPI00210C334C|nr:nicotinate-nucleotide--dimethylbenzimidazole phosphoribosyltransferase [Streptomyces sp. ODS05-4]
MTDTGQVPGDGQPHGAGTVEQPGVPAPGAYAYPDADPVPEDDDLLFMPGAQGAWSEHPAPQPGYEQGYAQPAYGYPQPTSHEQPPPAAPPAYQPAAHETGGRDSGAVDLGAVRMPEEPAPAAQPPAAPRRPLHLGPPVPDPTGGVVRSLADRGPATPGPAASGGLEYLDVPRETAPQSAEPWSAQPQPATAETVVPEAAPQPSYAPGSGPLPPAEFVPVEGTVPEPGNLAPTPQPTVPAPREAQAPTQEPAPEPVVAAPAAEPEPAPAPEPAAAAPAPVLEQPAEPAPAQEQAPEPAPAAEPAPEPAAVEAAPVADETAEPVAETPTAQPAPVEPQESVEPQEPLESVETASETTPAPAEPAHAVALPAEAVPVAPEQPALEEPAPAAEPEPVAPEAAPEPEPVAEAPVAAPAQPEAVEWPEPAAAEAEPAAEPAPEPEAAAAPEPEAITAPEPEAITAPEPEVITYAEPAAAQEPEPLAVPEPDQPAAAEPAPADVPAPTFEPLAAEPEPADVPAPAEVSAATASATAPAAAGFSDAEREAVLRVMRERRDVRNGFRSDPIPHEVLIRVLEAAHTAPSVGHSQPWDFVVIRSAETRRAMHELAQRQREAYAASLPKGRAKQFKELKIEAILDTPVNIVVTADPTRGGRHTLGRHTQPQMAPYSSALAVENLWLAARAEGLGVGWVSFFDEREMVRALGLPDHLEVVAYLCVGYVDEFPEEPELVQAGWSKRRPLSWVVHEETYGRRVLPGAEPHDLLQETVAGIRPLDAKALGEAWERQKRMTKPAGALGMLEIISAQLSGLSRMCPPPIPEPAAVAIFAGDHGVHAQGVTAWPQEVTAQMVANFLGGGAVCNAFAKQVGAEVCVVDVGVAADLPATTGLLPRKIRPGTSDFTTGSALTREEVLAAVEVGIETARDLVAAGNRALLTGEMGIANTTSSAALIAVYTGAEPAEVTGRGTGINDEMHARKVDVVRRALDLHRPDPADPLGVLAAVGGLEHAALVGFILGGASLRTPVVLDGVSAGAAALVARAIAPEALAACVAGHRSAEPGHVAALTKLGLRPLVDLDLRLGEGTGALLALPVIQSAARAMHEVATFDSAGVTEK